MTDSTTRSKSKAELTAEQQFEEASRALDEMVALSQQMGLYDMETNPLTYKRMRKSEATPEATPPEEKPDTAQSAKGSNTDG